MEKIIIKIGEVPLKIFFFIVTVDLLDTAAQLLIKKGLGTIQIESALSFICLLFNASHPEILLFWIGVVIYGVNFFLWMKVLSKIDVSVALPLASTSYILIPIAAVLFLHEHVHPQRWVGLAFIIAGIYFISQTKSKALPDE